MAFVIVALDGPTGVGKSTLARQLAERNQLLYVNTGSMFRCLAWKWNRLDKPENEEALQELGEQTQIVLEADGRAFCDNEEISSAIRTEEGFSTSLSGESLCTDSACTQVSAASVGGASKN